MAKPEYHASYPPGRWYIFACYAICTGSDIRLGLNSRNTVIHSVLSIHIGSKYRLCLNRPINAIRLADKTYNFVKKELCKKIH